MRIGTCLRSEVHQPGDGFMNIKILLLLPCLAFVFAACNAPGGTPEKSDKPATPEQPVAPRGNSR